MTYLISLAGVLQQHNGAPNPHGIALYHALADHGRVAVLGGADAAQDDWFLRANQMVEHSHLVPNFSEKWPTNPARLQAQIAYVRMVASPIDLVVVPDPESATHLFGAGLPILLYLHPQFTQPSFRPDWDSTAKNWEDLIGAVDYQIEQRAKASAAASSEDGE